MNRSPVVLPGTDGGVHNLSIYTSVQNKRLHFGDGFISMSQNSLWHLRLTVRAVFYLVIRLSVIVDHNLYTAGSVTLGETTSLHSAYMRICALEKSVSILTSRARQQVKKKNTTAFKLHIPKTFMKERCQQLSSHQGLFSSKGYCRPEAPALVR